MTCVKKNNYLMFFSFSTIFFTGFSYEGFSDALKVFTPLLALIASLIFVWKVLATLLRYIHVHV